MTWTLQSQTPQQIWALGTNRYRFKSPKDKNITQTGFELQPRFIIDLTDSLYSLTVLSFLIFCLLYSHTEVDTILGVATVKNRPDQALKPANVLQQMKLYRGNKTNNCE